MTSPRSRCSCLVLALVALPACVSRSSVPWPPKGGSCIEAHQTGSGLRSRVSYAIQGHEAKREEVQRLVERSAWAHERFRRYRTMNVVSASILSGGLATMFGGYLAAGAVSRPVLYVLSLAGLVMAGVGIAIAVTNDDPFRTAVWRYNEQAAWQGACPWPAPAEPPR